ncbi:Coenzyme F420 hydrogenase/dehydrogenase, beta subunit C-terminal domain [Bradyrhizobium sp. 5.13L]
MSKEIPLRRIRGAQPESVEEVVRAGLCTGCGLCASIVGPAISMGINIEGNMRPLVRGHVGEDKNAQVMATCPGVLVQGPGRPAETVVHPVFGPMREFHRSWSSDPVVRHKAAAGGTLTSLGRFLLASGRVQAVLHVRADDAMPWLSKSTISRTPDDVLQASQSRYGPGAPLVHLHKLLDEGKPFALIAKPCDISAVRALGRTDPRVGQLIPYMLTIFCGGVFSAHIAKAVVRHHGVEERDVVLYRYRGEGWPGPLTVQTRDGKSHALPYPDWYETGRFSYETQFRCKICPDMLGEVADISAPDGWILRDGKPIHEEAPGTNVAIARTQAGEELLHAAVAAGYLEIAPVSIREIQLMHAEKPIRRTPASAALFALRLMGQKSLRLSGYRTAMSLRRAGIRAILRQFFGTIRRVRAGDHREHVI